MILVVDAANVVGSVPDGWWRDRRNATRLLRDHLSSLTLRDLPTPAGPLPGDDHGARGPGPDAGPSLGRTCLRIILVAEGRARGLESTPEVEILDAPGAGDDEIVAVVQRLVGSIADPQVVVATTDRELRSRVQAKGATVMSARAVRHPRQ